MADLDLPELSRKLCSPLRRPLEPDGVDPTETPYPVDLPVVGGTIAFVPYDDSSSRVVLERCGHRSRTITHRPASERMIRAYDDRTIVWLEARRSGGRYVHTTVLYSVRSGRTRTLPFHVDSQFQLVGHRLYAVASGRLLRISLR